MWVGEVLFFLLFETQTYQTKIRWHAESWFCSFYPLACTEQFSGKSARVKVFRTRWNDLLLFPNKKKNYKKFLYTKKSKCWRYCDDQIVFYFFASRIPLIYQVFQQVRISLFPKPCYSVRHDKLLPRPLFVCYWCEWAFHVQILWPKLNISVASRF